MPYPARRAVSQAGATVRAMAHDPFEEALEENRQRSDAMTEASVTMRQDAAESSGKPRTSMRCTRMSRRSLADHAATAEA